MYNLTSAVNRLNTIFHLFSIIALAILNMAKFFLYFFARIFFFLELYMIALCISSGLSAWCLRHDLLVPA